MKSPAKLLLAVLVLFLLAGGSWYFLSAPGEDRPLDSGTSSVEPAPSGSANEVDTEPGGLAETGEEDATSRSEAPRSALENGAPFQTVEVRIRAPFGAPQDPNLVVYALTEHHEHDEFIEPFLENSPLADADVVHQAEANDEGRFEVRFPADQKQGWIHAAGDFMYSPESLSISLPTEEEVVLEPRVGALVRGRLVASEENPDPSRLSGVEIKFDLNRTLTTQRPDGRETVQLTLRTDAEGKFEMRCVPTEYSWLLEVLPEQLAAQRVDLRDLEPGVKREMEIKLGNGGSVRGRVLDPEGEPVAEAEVRALMIGNAFGFDDNEVGTTTTDANGAFELDRVPVGEIALKADHPDYLETKRLNVMIQGDEVSDGVELKLSPGRSLTGIVRMPDGSPAVGVTVSVEFDMAYMAGLSAFNALRGAEAETKTGEDGRFQLGGLGQGPFVVTSTTRPPQEASEEAAEEQPTAPDEPEPLTARIESVQPDSDVELSLHGPLGISGRVVTSEDQPLTKFSLRAIRRADGAFGPVGLEDTNRDFESEDGSFFLDGLVDGNWDLTARAEGFVSLTSVRVQLPGDEEILLTVVESSSISGRVLTSRGAPVEGATVLVERGQAAWQNAMLTVDDREQATTDESGSFLFEDLPPGSTALIASHPDHCKSIPQAFELTGGARVEEAELTLREGGRLTGIAYAKSGELAVGYLIALNSNEMQQRFGRTDEAGEFVIEKIPPGPWQVVAMNSNADLSADADGGYAGVMNSMTVSQAEILEGETTHIVLGAPPANPVKITGKVSHDGEPYLGANLIFFQQGTKLYENMKFATFDEEARYSVVVDGPGPYVVYLQKMGRTQVQQQNVEFSIDVPLVAEHTHDFEVPLGRISGRVTDADGVPATNTRVTIATDGGFRSDVLMGGQYSEVMTDGEGKYELEGLRPGTYMVAAGGAMLLDATGDSGSKLGRVTRGGVRLSENEWKRNFDFQLGAPGELEVSVVGLDGLALDGAGIFLRDSEGRPLEPFNFASTDATGRCLLRGLAPGDYSVMARKGLAVSQESPPVRITQGATEKLELRVEEGTVLWIKLKDSDNEDVRASVAVRDTDSGRDWASFFGMDDLQVLYMEGAFSPTEHRLGPLPPGKYKIEARGAAGSKTKPVTLRGEPERRITMRLRP